MFTATSANRLKKCYNAGMKKSSSQSRKSARKGYTIGRSGFAKISAVEGIRLTDAMDRDFQEFERKGLSPRERREAIAKKYAKVR
jgi:hypothetical protein